MSKGLYLLGVDGGGTGCRARLCTTDGRVIGEGTAGPANLGLGVSLAVESILGATRNALEQAHLSLDALSVTHAGLGIAAANVTEHRQALMDSKLPFMSVSVRSDAEVACLGAHELREGGILILGTGSQGVIFRDGLFQTVGGWGFALSDSGAGATLGHRAVRRAFLAHEGVKPASAMTQFIVAHFQGESETMFRWASQAKPKDWGTFAQIVFEHASLGDVVALSLVRESVHDAEQMLRRMITLGAKNISLMGGLAKPSRPYMAPCFASVLVEPRGDALDGALSLAKLAWESEAR
jgi:glucosamine kinase